MVLHESARRPAPRRRHPHPPRQASRGVHPWLRILLGAGIVLTAVPVGLLLAAVLLLGECPGTCIPEGERPWGWLAALAAGAIGLAGARLVAAGWRDAQAGSD